VSRIRRVGETPETRIADNFAQGALCIGKGSIKCFGEGMLLAEDLCAAKKVGGNFPRGAPARAAYRVQAAAFRTFAFEFG
jgi:hypothetical protein